MINTAAVDHRRIWRLAGPIILSNLSVPLVGAVDTAVVGRLPDPVYIGAVALGAVVFSLVFWVFSFLRMGTVGFVAQAFGAGDRDEIAATLARALLLALLLGALLILLRAPISSLAFFAAAGDPQLQALTDCYFQLRVWSAPATLANYALLGALIGLQRSGAALALQLLLNFSNVALDFFFVVSLGMDVDGVALATLIAEYLTAAFGLYLLWRLCRPLPTDWRTRMLDLAKLWSLTRVNIDLLVRTACLSGATFYFTRRGATMGSTLLAANAILMHLQSFLAHGLDGFAHAAEALTGAAKGRRDVTEFNRAVRLTTQWALALALIYVLGYALLGEQLVALFTNIAAVRRAANDYLPWLVLSPLISVWSFQLDGIFIGTMQSAAMRNAAILSAGGFVLAAALLQPWGNHGLWLALMIFMVLRALTLLYWYPQISAAIAKR